ncbi:TonB-dependent receptor [Flammeovirga yaeyamensis]|uniref:TonB-dependent receptor n=1 Tax=Flammeovirga yaeyamensis TaxID=367791 RepID=A0AAX1N0N8_9BACT|nr:TonB-dependent receptor [Flammeovirga yaeyamensis]MBB3698605.1 outer membrane receptor for ferrienterochelin and colicins [Flammeovirga yaeyamensis]NMF34047.1 TonB-dependent receptor [Flammeovirga yaeyamensis]QWG01035.1 TonB-dependent receptor [Flammeovirga yaeyamensis]
MKNFALIQILLLLSCAITNANPIKVIGHITSGDEHVPFANVSINDGQKGVFADKDGHFTIELEENQTYSFLVSVVGYKDQTIEFKPTRSNHDIHFNLTKDLLELNEVIVSSSRRSQSRQETSSVVNVVGSDFLMKNDIKVVGEGLNYIPGTRVESTCGNCGSTQLRLNGLEGPYTQILIDSRPLFSGLVGVYGLEQIPVAMIDQVEVVRGGGSVLYGANAIGGTVNIITKSPKFNAYEVGTNFGTIDGKSHDYNMYFNTSLVSKNEKTSSYIYGSYRNRDVWNANPDDIYYQLDDDGNPTGSPIKDDFSELTAMKTLSLGTKVYHQFSDYNKLSFDLKYTHDERRGGNKLDLPKDQADITESIDMHIGTAMLNHDWFSKDKKLHLNSYLSGQYVHRDSYYGAYQQKDGFGLTTGQTVVAGSQLNINLGEFWNGKSFFVTGVEYINDQIHDKKLSYFDEDLGQNTQDATVSDQISNTYAIFAQNEWVSNRWSVLVGARWDFVDIVDKQTHENDKRVNSINPRVNLKYKLNENMQLRGGFATGFRAPQMFSEDLHIEVTSGQGVRTQLDPNLKPESSLSYNLAWDFDKTFGHVQTYFLVEGFHTRIKDRFDNQYNYLEDGTLILFKRNSTSDAIVQGINLEGRVAPSEKLSFQAAYTIQSAKYEEENQWGDEDSSTSKYILRTPNQYGSLSADYKITNQWTATMTGVYTGSMHVPYLPGGFIDGQLTTEEELIQSEQFFDMGLKIAYMTKLTKDSNIQIGAGVKNIFNQMQSNFVSGVDKDAAFVYGPITPRMFYIDIRIGNLLN